MTKTCSRCGITKDASEYQRDSSQASGIRSACKACSRGRVRKRGEPVDIRNVNIRCPEVPLAKAGLGESCLDDLELGPAGIAPTTPEEAHKAAPEGFHVKGVSTLYDDSGASRHWVRTGLGPAGLSPVTPEDAHAAAPGGFHVKGVSTFYDGSGAVRGHWVKTAQDDVDRLALLEKALVRITEPYRGVIEQVPPPAFADEDLLCVVPLGDPHIGMYAWAEEAGADFNLEIAERNAVAAVEHLIALAPAAATMLLIDLGDTLHGDGPENRTPRSGHPVDVDTRWSKVISVAIRIKRRLIDLGLAKFRNVVSMHVSGNHDPTSSVMMRHVIQALYDREPRVTVDMSPAEHHWYRFGASLIGATHGDKCKLSDLAGIMAVDRAKDWGDVNYRHWYVGHVHHDQLKEFPGVIVETFRTLAPKDAWHAAQGYRSGQDLKLDVFHKRWGRINRHVIGIEQINDKAA